MKEKNATKTILRSGFIGGSLDAISGVIVYYIWLGRNPIQILQLVASGLHGPTAIGGGAMIAIAGLIYHFLIAYVCAIVYFYAYPKIRILSKYKISAGLVYGLGIWLVMNLLVLPNSNIPKVPFDTGLAIAEIIWHMVLLGLPIAIITSRHYDE